MKKRTIIDIFLIFILLIFLIFLGTRDYSKVEKNDNKRFDKEYSMVSKDNVFTYADEEKVLEILQSGDGIIFMGFSENEWSNYYAKILNDAAKANNINEIYYYNFLADRQKQSVNYKKIVEILNTYLKKDDLGQTNIYAPCLVVLKAGIVMAFDDETSFVNGNVEPETYWTEENIYSKTEQFNNIFTIYLGGQVDGGEE
jgi:hypothetical protein